MKKIAFGHIWPNKGETIPRTIRDSFFIYNRRSSADIDKKYYDTIEECKGGWFSTDAQRLMDYHINSNNNYNFLVLRKGGCYYEGNTPMANRWHGYLQDPNLESAIYTFENNLSLELPVVINLDVCRQHNLKTIDDCLTFKQDQYSADWIIKEFYADIWNPTFQQYLINLYNVNCFDQGTSKLFNTIMMSKSGFIPTYRKNDKYTVFFMNTQFITNNNIADWKALGPFDNYVGITAGFRDFISTTLCTQSANSYNHFDINGQMIKTKKWLIANWDGSLAGLLNGINYIHQELKVDRDKIFPFNNDVVVEWYELMIKLAGGEVELQNKWKEYASKKHNFKIANAFADPNVFAKHCIDGKNLVILLDIYLGNNELWYGMENMNNKLTTVLKSLTTKSVVVDYVNVDEDPRIENILDVPNLDTDRYYHYNPEWI
jgi:hypothetical protein